LPSLHLQSSCSTTPALDLRARRLGLCSWSLTAAPLLMACLVVCSGAPDSQVTPIPNPRSSCLGLCSWSSAFVYFFFSLQVVGHRGAVEEPVISLVLRFAGGKIGLPLSLPGCPVPVSLSISLSISMSHSLFSFASCVQVVGPWDPLRDQSSGDVERRRGPGSLHQRRLPYGRLAWR
jgi:hypothetical protein